MFNVIIETDRAYFNTDYYRYDKEKHNLIFHVPFNIRQYKTLKNVACEIKFDNTMVYIRATEIKGAKGK
jgi:hypothetical protein